MAVKAVQLRPSRYVAYISMKGHEIPDKSGRLDSKGNNLNTPRCSRGHTNLDERKIGTESPHIQDRETRGRPINGEEMICPRSILITGRQKRKSHECAKRRDRTYFLPEPSFAFSSASSVALKSFDNSSDNLLASTDLLNPERCSLFASIGPLRLKK